MTNEHSLLPSERMLQTAKNYCQTGFSVMPIAAGSKRPVVRWKSFETELIAEDELDRLYRTPVDGKLPDRVAVIGGPISGGLEMLDFDLAGVEFEPWKELIPVELFERLLIERTPNEGYHVAYRCEIVEANQGLCHRRIFDEAEQHAGWKTTIETRGVGGYCVVAPSEGYTLIQGDWKNLHVISPEERDLLIEAARSLDRKPKDAVSENTVFERQSDRPGDLFNADADTPRAILELLLRHGWTMDHETEQHWFLKHPGNRSKEHSTTLSKSNGFLHTFSPNTPFEQNRNTPPFEIYAILEADGDFTRAAAKLAEDGFVPPPPPPVDLSGILSQTTASRPDEDSLFKIWTCPELMQADLKQEFLIENVLVEGQPCIIGGPKKCLKTSIMLDMAVSLAAGVPFLRRFAVPVQKRVLVMSGESGLVTIRNTIRRITESIDLDPQEIEDLLICDRVPRLDNLSHIDILTRAMKEFKPDVVVFDPAYLMLTTDKPESLFATGGQLSAISLLCQIHGATIIIAHHNSKSSNVIGRTPDLDDLSWSGFAEFARQWILVSRNKAYDPMTGDQHIKMVVGGSYGHGGEYDIRVQEGVYPDRRWDVEMTDLNAIVGQVCSESGSERRAERRRQRILDELRNHREPLSKRRLMTLTGINYTYVTDMVNNLVADGTLIESQITSANGMSYSGYSLSNPA